MTMGVSGRGTRVALACLLAYILAVVTTVRARSAFDNSLQPTDESLTAPNAEFRFSANSTKKGSSSENSTSSIDGDEKLLESIAAGTAFGGEGNSTGNSTAKSGASFTWEDTSAFGPKKRSGHTFISVGGRLVLFGGCYLGQVCYDDTWVFDPVTKSWYLPKVQGFVPGARGRHAAVAIGTDMYIIGGGFNGQYRHDVYKLDTKTFVWSLVNTQGLVPSGRIGISAVALGTDIFVFGGLSEDGYQNDLYRLNTLTSTWSHVSVNGNAPSPRADYTAVLYKTSMYLFGGTSDLGEMGGLHRLDLQKLTWSRPVSKGHAPSARHSMSAGMRSHLLLIAGGCNDDKNACYNDTFVLNVDAMEWQQLPVAVPKPVNGTAGKADAKDDKGAPKSGSGASVASGSCVSGASKGKGSATSPLGVPVEDVGCEAKSSGFKPHWLPPGGGMAGDFASNTSVEFYVFSGCLFHMNCSYRLLALKVPLAFKPDPEADRFNPKAHLSPIDPNAPPRQNSLQPPPIVPTPDLTNPPAANASNTTSSGKANATVSSNPNKTPVAKSNHTTASNHTASANNQTTSAPVKPKVAGYRLSQSGKCASSDADADQFGPFPARRCIRLSPSIGFGSVAVTCVGGGKWTGAQYFSAMCAGAPFKTVKGDSGSKCSELAFKPGLMMQVECASKVHSSFVETEESLQGAPLSEDDFTIEDQPAAPVDMKHEEAKEQVSHVMAPAPAAPPTAALHKSPDTTQQAPKPTPPAATPNAVHDEPKAAENKKEEALDHKKAQTSFAKRALDASVDLVKKAAATVTKLKPVAALSHPDAVKADNIRLRDPSKPAPVASSVSDTIAETQPHPAQTAHTKFSGKATPHADAMHAKKAGVVPKADAKAATPSGSSLQASTSPDPVTTSNQNLRDYSKDVVSRLFIPFVSVLLVSLACGGYVFCTDKKPVDPAFD